jgi:hypothetical protein
MSGLCILGQPYRCEEYGVSLHFRSVRRVVLCLERGLSTIALHLSCWIFEQGSHSTVGTGSRHISSLNYSPFLYIGVRDLVG